MVKSNNHLQISDDMITDKIYLVRGQKIMLDSDLSELYNVEPKHLISQLKEI